MKRVLVGVFACLLGVGLLCLTAGHAALPGATPESALLLPSTRTGNAEIFLMYPKWGDARNLTRNKSENTFPAWTADAKRIAFISDRAGRPNVYVMDADGQNVKQLTKEEGEKDFCSCPTWSPDGKKIAYCQFRAATYAQVVVMDADGGGSKTIRENGWDPAWSPDGKKIAFTSWTEKGFKVFVMDNDGGNAKEFATNDNNLGSVYPAWSPDGKKIAYTDLDNGALEIFVCDADGTNIKKLTTLGGMNSGAAWSPDGKTIAFQHNDNVTAAVFFIDADGGEPLEIATLRDSKVLARGYRPAWRPK